MAVPPSQRTQMPLAAVEGTHTLRKLAKAAAATSWALDVPTLTLVIVGVPDEPPPPLAALVQRLPV